MSPHEAAKVLTEHNRWRRGEIKGEMPYPPKELGEAIDTAVAAIRAAKPGVTRQLQSIRSLKSLKKNKEKET